MTALVVTKIEHGFAFQSRDQLCAEFLGKPNEQTTYNIATSTSTQNVQF